MNQTDSINPTSDIKRIRWTRKRNVIKYYFSRSIWKNFREDSTATFVSKPSEMDWKGLTELGVKLVDSVLEIMTIRAVTTGPFLLSVELLPTITFADVHEQVLKLVKDILFSGEADIREVGKCRPGQAAIKYKCWDSDTVYWFGVTESLLVNEKSDTTVVVSASSLNDSFKEVRKKGELTLECQALLEELFALKGVTKIWVDPFEMRIQQARVFSWTDYRDVVLKLLKKHIFKDDDIAVRHLR